MRLATIRVCGASPGPAAPGGPVGYGMGCRGLLARAITTYDRSGRRRRWPRPCAASSPRRLIETGVGQHGTITRRKLQQRIRVATEHQEINDMLTQAVEAGLIVRTSNGYAAGITVSGNNRGNN